MQGYKTQTKVTLWQVAGATSRAGDAHSSGTPDLTLMGPLCLTYIDASLGYMTLNIDSWSRHS